MISRTDIRRGQWVVFSCVLAAIIYLGFTTNVLQRMYEADATRLSTVIVVLYIISHLFVYRFITTGCKYLEDKLWFTSQLFMSLGMIGTVIGFILLFDDSFTDINLEDTQQLVLVIEDITVGIGTALVTTLAGLVCGALLQGELVFLHNHDLDDEV